MLIDNEDSYWCTKPFKCWVKGFQKETSAMSILIVVRLECASAVTVYSTNLITVYAACIYGDSNMENDAWFSYVH